MIETNIATAPPTNGSSISLVQDQRQGNNYVFWQSGGGHVQQAVTVPFPPQAVGAPFVLNTAVKGTRLSSTMLDGVSQALVFYQNDTSTIDAMTVNRNGAILSTVDV